MQVVEKFAAVLNALVDPGAVTDVADLISDKILTATEDTSEGSVEMRFYSEGGVIDDSQKNSKVINVAIVDDDAVVRKMLQTAFKSINAECELFNSGAEFLGATNKKVFDLVILDIFMPGISGFDILTNLHTKRYPTPVIVYSNPTQREAVIQALSLGAKSYLIKPLKPEAIIQKAIEVLHSKL